MACHLQIDGMQILILADPDPACHLDVDPDPAYHFDAAPDLTFQFNANPDPQQCS